MNKMVIGLGLAVILMFVGCAAIAKVTDKIAPNQTQVVSTTDPNTGVTTNTVVEIVGTHTATPITADTAGMIPYGSLVLNAFLLAVNFFQKVQSDKLGKGLTSTIQAIETAGNDPAIATAVAQLKVDLANAHQIAGIQPLINDIIAKKT